MEINKMHSYCNRQEFPILVEHRSLSRLFYILGNPGVAIDVCIKTFERFHGRREG